MKHIFLLLVPLLLTIGCKKNAIEDSPPLHVIETHIVSTTLVNDTVVCNYDNGLTSYSYKSIVALQRGNRKRMYFIADMNHHKFSLSTMNGVFLYSLNYNDAGAIDELKVGKIDNTAMRTSKAITWEECMDAKIKDCAEHWYCTIPCAALYKECFVGMAVACLAIVYDAHSPQMN